MEENEKFLPENAANFIFHTVHRTLLVAGFKPKKKPNGSIPTLPEAVHERIQQYLKYGRNKKQDLILEALKVC